MAWIDSATVIVAEVTTASLGVGYEIGRMVERNARVGKACRKPILCLYRPSVGTRLSAMIAGCSDIWAVEYHTFEEARQAIDAFFGQAQYHI